MKVVKEQRTPWGPVPEDKRIVTLDVIRGLLGCCTSSLFLTPAPVEITDVRAVGWRILGFLRRLAKGRCRLPGVSGLVLEKPYCVSVTLPAVRAAGHPSQRSAPHVM